jgi:hypothetical protein
VRVEVRPVLGEAVDGLYPVHKERWNGVVRNRLNALTRKTRVFAKTVKTWDVLVILCLFEHNGLRPHWALREAGGGPAGGAAVSAADASDGHRVDRALVL